MAREISNSNDVIDSRDVIERIAELEGERDDAFSGAYATWDAGEASHELSRQEFAQEHWEIAHPDEADELRRLLALQDKAEGYAPDWKYGTGLIRSTYWVEYAEEMLKDIGDLPKDVPGYIVIDWEATAQNLLVDYTTVDFDGVEYYFR